MGLAHTARMEVAEDSEMVDDTAAETDAGVLAAVRKLDQNKTDGLDDEITNFWTVLVRTTPQKHHAPETAILRWLLRLMSGQTELAEQVRRFPTSWQMLGLLFRRVPSFRLAKALAERKFLSILEKTFTEISDSASSTIGGENDVQTALGKRKRSAEPSFDLAEARSMNGRLQSAEALFGAIKSLSECLDNGRGVSCSTSQMGLEQIRSMFAVSSNHMADVMKHGLQVVEQSLDQTGSNPPENQASWMSTLESLWDLHLRSEGDAAEIATSLWSTGCVVLAKLTRSKGLAIDANVQNAWTRDLRRFFTSNMLLPTRTTYQNTRQVDVINIAVEIMNQLPTLSSPELFILAARSLRGGSEAGMKRKQDEWMQRVFSVVEEPLRAAAKVPRNKAMLHILETAHTDHVGLSPMSLQAVCRTYTHDNGRLDLQLLAKVAALEPNVFLIDTTGQALLSDVLEYLRETVTPESDPMDITAAQDLIQSLVIGFAKSRDLAGFFKRWAELLGFSPALKRDEEDIWAAESIRNKVTAFVQTAMSTKQLLALLSWVKTLKPEQNFARVVMLNTIVAGITIEEYVDALEMQPSELLPDLDQSWPTACGQLWWDTVTKVVSWSTTEQATQIWEDVKPALNASFASVPVTDPISLHAFRCWTAVALAQYPDGKYLSSILDSSQPFLRRLLHDGSQAPLAFAKEAERPRVGELFVNSGVTSELWQALLSNYNATTKIDVKRFRTLLSDGNLNNTALASKLVDAPLAVLVEAKLQDMFPASLGSAVENLLCLKDASLDKEQHLSVIEVIMRVLPNIVVARDDPEQPELIKSLLSLLVQHLGAVSTPKAITTQQLLEVGSLMVSSCQSIDDVVRVSDKWIYECWTLFDTLAHLVFEKMTASHGQAHQDQLNEAVSLLRQVHSEDTTQSLPVIIVMQHLCKALLSSKGTGRFDKYQDVSQLQDLCADLLVAQSSQLSDAFKVNNVAHQSTLAGLEHVVIEQMSLADPTVLAPKLSQLRPTLEALASNLIQVNLRIGFDLKALLYRCFASGLQDALKIPLAPLRSHDAAAEPHSYPSADMRDVASYVDSVISTVLPVLQPRVLADLCRWLDEATEPLGYLLGTCRLGLRMPSPKEVKLDADLGPQSPAMALSAAYTHLASRVEHVPSNDELMLSLQIMSLFLDERAGSMKQVNVDETLGAVSVICNGQATLSTDTRSPAKVFPWLCRLVETILKLHRHRLDGRMHLLVDSLQSLLRLLITDKALARSRATHADQFARLLTMVCEPSVASVTRKSHGANGPLDSVKDAAKRVAGQHMYFILILFFKLQLEHPVSREVREGLAPGLYAILDVSKDHKRTLNEAMDEGGRALFKDFYAQYLKFGKWSGI